MRYCSPGMGRSRSASSLGSAVAGGGLSGLVRLSAQLLVWSRARDSRLWLSGPCFPLTPNGPWLFMYFLLSRGDLRTLLHKPRGPCDES